MSRPYWRVVSAEEYNRKIDRKERIEKGAMAILKWWIVCLFAICMCITVGMVGGGLYVVAERMGNDHAFWRGIDGQ